MQDDAGRSIGGGDLDVPHPSVAVGAVAELAAVERKALHRAAASAMHGVHAAERGDANLDASRGEAGMETGDVKAAARDTAVTLRLDGAARIGERARAVRDCSSSALDKRRAARRRRLATGIGRHTGRSKRRHCVAQSAHARRIRAARSDTVRTGALARIVESGRRGNTRTERLRRTKIGGVAAKRRKRLSAHRTYMR